MLPNETARHGSKGYISQALKVLHFERTTKRGACSAIDGRAIRDAGCYLRDMLLPPMILAGFKETRRMQRKF